MTKFSTTVIALLLVNCLSFVLSQQSNLSQCRIVCDEEQDNPYPASRRGRKGQKGEKGDVGSPGELGESNKRDISKNARNIKTLGTTLSRQFSYVETKFRAIHSNSLNIEHLYEVMQKQSEMIDELSKCEVEQIENASSNVREDSGSSTAILRHGDVIEYKCNDGYISFNVPTRTCSRGKLLPSFNDQPFTCEDICSQMPCNNNGTCNLDMNAEYFYTCSCQLPYFGEHCEKKHCVDDQPCGKGLSCVPWDEDDGYDDGKGYVCVDMCSPEVEGDECLQDVCYRFEISSVSGSTYQSAKDHCVEQGGEIVSNLLGSDGAEYHSEIRRVADSYGYGFWVGISDLETEGRYAFEATGRNATDLMFEWAEGEPNNWDGDEDCVHYSKILGGLNDRICEYHPYYENHGVLCQIPTEC